MKQNKRPEPTKAYSDMTDDELLLEMETRRVRRDGEVELILIFAAKRLRKLIEDVEFAQKMEEGLRRNEYN